MIKAFQPVTTTGYDFGHTKHIIDNPELYFVNEWVESNPIMATIFRDSTESAIKAYPVNHSCAMRSIFDAMRAKYPNLYWGIGIYNFDGHLLPTMKNIFDCGLITSVDGVKYKVRALAMNEWIRRIILSNKIKRNPSNAEILTYNFSTNNALPENVVSQIKAEGDTEENIIKHYAMCQFKTGNLDLGSIITSLNQKKYSLLTCECTQATFCGHFNSKFVSVFQFRKKVYMNLDFSNNYDYDVFL